MLGMGSPNMQRWLELSFRPPMTLDDLYGQGASGFLYAGAMSPPALGLPDANLFYFYEATMSPGEKMPPPQTAHTGPRPTGPPAPDPTDTTTTATPDVPSRGYHTLTSAWANRQARTPGYEQA